MQLDLVRWIADQGDTPGAEARVGGASPAGTAGACVHNEHSTLSALTIRGALCVHIEHTATRGQCAPCRRIGCWSALPCWAGRNASWHVGPAAIRPRSSGGQAAAVPSMTAPLLGWNGWWRFTSRTPHPAPGMKA